MATHEDPATARAGETVYEFVPRSWAGNLVDGYQAEARRLRAKGLPLLSLQNRCGFFKTSDVLFDGLCL